VALRLAKFALILLRRLFMVVEQVAIYFLISVVMVVVDAMDV